MNELQVSTQEIPAVFYSEKYQQDVTTSLAIARDFEKQPKNVLQDIDGLIEKGKKLREELRERLKSQPIKNELTENEKLLLKVEEMFFEGIYFNKSNKPCRMFYITRDGFTLLVMGFSGDKAFLWKLKYLQLFNQLEDFYHSTHQAKQNVQSIDPYKMTAEQQFQLELRKLDYKIEKVALEKMKFEAKSKKISEQSTVKNPAVQSFSWNEPLKVEKTHHSSDWVNITELINEQLKSYFPDVKKSRKLGANSLNDFLVENDYAERDFSELWSDGHYEDYTTIRFKEKGQELIQKGIVTYAKSSLKKNEDNVFYRTVCPKWHKTKAKDFFLEHQDEIKEFLAKPKKKSKKEPKKES